MNVVKKYKDMSVQVRAALWYTVCNFFQNGMAFLLVPVYLYFLSTAEYGKWVTFQAWKDILIIFASLNLYCGVYTKTLVDIKDDRDKYTSCMQGLGTTITAVLFIIYLLLKKTAEEFLGYNSITIYLMFGFFIAFPSLQFWLTRQRVEYKYKKMVLVTIVSSVITPLLSIYLVVTTDLKSYAIIYGYLISQILIGLFFYIFHFIKKLKFYDKYYWSCALKFNIPLIPHYLSLIVLGQSDRIMIKKLCSDEDAGVYGFGYQIASVLSVVISAINGSRVPWTYEQLRDKTYSGLKRVSIYLCIMMGMIVLAVSLLSPEIVKILTIFGNKYEEYKIAIYVIPVVALGLYFTFVYDLFCSVEFYYGKTAYIMVASCIGAVLNIVLNAIFIPIVGLIAAAYTTLICYIVFMFMHYIFMKKVCRDEDIKDDVYDSKILFLISAVMFVLVVLCLISFNSNIVRYIAIVFFIVAAFVKKDLIISTIKEIKKRN